MAQMTSPNNPDMAHADARIRRRHRLAVAAMLLCTLLWSLSGIVIRSLESATRFEVTFYRGAACALFLTLMMITLHRRAWLGRITSIGKAGLASAVMWTIMLTAFSIAITLTTVAKTFVLIAISPLIAALLARYWLGERIAWPTWAAIAVAGAGVVIMVADGLGSDDGMPNSALGMLIAAAVPVASAINLMILRKSGGAIDMVPAVLIGALLLGDDHAALPVSDAGIGARHCLVEHAGRLSGCHSRRATGDHGTLARAAGDCPVGAARGGVCAALGVAGGWRTAGRRNPVWRRARVGGLDRQGVSVDGPGLPGGQGTGTVTPDGAPAMPEAAFRSQSLRDQFENEKPSDNATHGLPRLM